MQRNYTVSSRAAAATLAAQLGDTPDHWATKLANWRKPDRLSPLSWSSPPGRPKYDPAELEAFASARKAERAALALPYADPRDDLPTASASAVRNEEGRHLVQIEWRDANTSGALALAVESAEQFNRSLTRAITALKDAFDQDFDRAMDQDARALRVKAPGPEGEVPR